MSTLREPEELPEANGPDKSMERPISEKPSAHSSSEQSTSQPVLDKAIRNYPPTDPQDEPPSEKSPLPCSSRPSLIQRTTAHLLAPISPTHASALFILCSLISGLVDSTIYNAYGTFVSMQTGNTVFLGLGGATPDSSSKPYGWAKSFVSIVCFCLGCLTFSNATRWMGKQRRGSLVASFLAQTLIIFVAAAVVQAGAVNGSLETITDDVDWWAVIPIALLSFQSAGQIVGSRAVGLAELPTVVLTSMLHDIFTDEKLVARKNVKRNRRVTAFFAILIGAICGGFIGEGTERAQIPLWIAGGVKLGITVAWAAWPEGRTPAV